MSLRKIAGCFLSVAFSATLSLSGANAAPVTIDFDDLTIGAYPASVFVTTQYAGLGVTFSGAGYPPSFPGSGLVAVQYGLMSGPNSAFVGTAPITATFAADVSNVSLDFADTEISSFLGYMEAFDAFGASLGSTSALTPPGSPFGAATLALNFSGIRSVLFYTDSDGAVVDDFSFVAAGAAVPEPVSAGVVGLGLMFMGLRRRRQTRVAS